MSAICPTITAYEPHEFREQLLRLEPFARRVHIDLMFRRPLEHLETLMSLKPNMVIVHAEAEGDLLGMVEHVHKFGIKMGIALLQPTQPADAAELIAAADHVLIFSGNLGHQ